MSSKRPLERRAVFSPCGAYRYTLWRELNPVFLVTDRSKIPYVNFILCNPSTATDTEDDPTIRRCKSFAFAAGYDALCVTNIFALRSTDPAGLRQTADPVGPANDYYLLEVAKRADMIIAAWSQHGKLFGRSQIVKSLLKLTGKPVYYLKQSKGGEPQHPLYLPATARPTEWINF